MQKTKNRLASAQPETVRMQDAAREMPGEGIAEYAAVPDQAPVKARAGSD